MRPRLAPFVLLALACNDTEGPAISPGAEQARTPSAPIRLVTDQSGVTHVQAKTDADAFYGAGYSMARDRLFQMEINRRRAQGRMAELLGSKRKKDDIGARAFDFVNLGRQDEQRLRRERPADAALLDAWVKGINARLDEVRSGKAPRPYGLGPGELDFVPEPWEPHHATAIGKTLAFGLSTSFEAELLATAILRIAPSFAAKVPILQPAYDEYIMAPGKKADPAQVTPPKVPASGPPAPPGPGPTFSALSGVLNERSASNNWAVSAALSSNGKPLLAGDPHQALTSPARLWPLHMSSASGTLDVIGFSFVGTPGVQLGHNARVGWTATTNFADVMDMWDVEYNDDRSAVLLGGQPRPVKRRAESIRVRAEGAPVGQGEDEQVEIVEVPGFGVVIPDVVLPVPRPLLIKGDAILFRWTGFEPSIEFSAYLAMDRARNLGEYQAAADLIEVGALNLVAADASRIGYHVRAKIPDRGQPSSRPMPWRILPGDDERTLWTGALLGPDRMPHLDEPASGYLATGNTDPWGFTADGDVENDPFYYGTFYATGFRPHRIRQGLDELIAKKQKLDRADMAGLQADTRSPMAETLLPHLSQALDGIENNPALAAFKGRDDLKDLAAALLAWDQKMALDSGPALLFLGMQWFAAKRLFEKDASALLFNAVASESPPFFLGLLRNAFEARFKGAEALMPAGGRGEILLSALDDARQWLVAGFGSADPSAYSLGALHAAEFPSVYGQKLDIGRFPVPGGADTVNVSPAPFFDDSGKPLDLFASTEMALYRMALGFGADGVPEATFDLATGSSEDPSSPFFQNLQADWVGAKQRPLLFRPQEIEGAIQSEMTLPAAPLTGNVRGPSSVHEDHAAKSPTGQGVKQPMHGALMRAASALLLGASLALGVSAASAESEAPPPPPRAVVTETTTLELKASSWPMATLPVFAATSAPSPLPPPPSELRVIDASAPPAKKDQANPRPAPPPQPRGTTVFHVEPAAPGLFLAGWERQISAHSVSFSFACGDGSRGNRHVFYWELLQRTGDDSARLVVAETWIDPKTCSLGGGTRAELSLAAAATFEGGPIVFGARAERGLLLFFPEPLHFSLSTADLEPPGSQAPRGPLSQVFLPARKGDAVVASALLLPHNINTWRYAFSMPPLEPSRVSLLPLTVRVDVSQSIREETPLALLTLQRSLPDEPEGRPSAAPLPKAPSRFSGRLNNPFRGGKKPASAPRSAGAGKPARPGIQKGDLVDPFGRR